MEKKLLQRESEILTGIIDILKQYLNPYKIILFGSRASRSYSRNADFDIAVDKERVDLRLQRKIKERIDKVSGLYKVDIVFFNSVDQKFKDIIIKTGRIIYERDSK